MFLFWATQPLHDNILSHSILRSVAPHGLSPSAAASHPWCVRNGNGWMAATSRVGSPTWTPRSMSLPRPAPWPLSPTWRSGKLAAPPANYNRRPSSKYYLKDVFLCFYLNPIYFCLWFQLIMYSVRSHLYTQIHRYFVSRSNYFTVLILCPRHTNPHEALNLLIHITPW